MERDEDGAPMRVAADVVILTIRRREFEVLLIERGAPPFEGRLAVPGGFVEADETVDEAAERELLEETGVRPESARLERFGVYSEPGRDPRRRVVSVAHVAMVPDAPDPRAGGDAAAARWLPVDRALGLRLAFDHARILADAVEHAGRRLETTTAAAAFCGAEFTIAELRRVYETVWRTRLDPGNFHRKVTRNEGFLEPTGRTTSKDGGRPAALYRAGPAERLQLPVPRPDRAAPDQSTCLGAHSKP